MKDRAIVAAIVAGICIIVAAIVAFGAAVPEAHSDNYRPPLCVAEDVCQVDYRNARWFIMECDGACDDRGARTHWERVYIR